MEATSDYWKPFYYLLEETLPVMLVNAKAGEEHPGPQDRCLRRGMAGAAGRARAAAGLVRPARADPRVAGSDPGPGHRHPGPDPGGPRLEKFLECTGIKLSARGLGPHRGLVPGDARGAHRRGTGPAGPRAASPGPACGQRSRNSIDALTGRFSEHHAFMVRLHLDRSISHPHHRRAHRRGSTTAMETLSCRPGSR